MHRVRNFALGEFYIPKMIQKSYFGCPNANFMRIKRTYPIGAEVCEEGVSFRVFASLCKQVEVCLESDSAKNEYYLLKDEGTGYFSGIFPQFKHGVNYRFRLDGHPDLYPDPASRYQPKGPFGPSQVINPMLFQWTDHNWRGIKIERQIIYELHVGTFTTEGTLSAAKKQLSELANLGITVIELMPLNEFPGQFGWGYDGVNLFAPSRLYGTPDDLKDFIDQAHRLSIAVILDVVYNHFGVEGNYVHKFSDNYFKDEDNEWGKSINFDLESTREFITTNVQYWIEEMHFDGLRVDATQAINSTTPVHILEEIRAAAYRACKNRDVIVTGENESQASIIFRPIDRGGYGFDALWNDDFHHTARVRLTGSRAAYYTDYEGSVQELISCIKHGYLYQGQYYSWQKKYRGTPCLDIKPSSFILFLENHDQIANSGRGQRLHQLTDFGNLKTMTSLLLLAPGTPLLFQGQEFASSTPFFFFADHLGDLPTLINNGRKEFLSQFPDLATADVQAILPNPAELSTFLKCKLDFSEREHNAPIYQLHKDLIQLRKTDPLLANDTCRFDAAILSPDLFLLRFFDKNEFEQKENRLLILNFGSDYDFDPLFEPLIAPLENTEWTMLWSSEFVKYGGNGIAPLEFSKLKIRGHSAIFLSSTAVPKMF